MVVVSVSVERGIRQVAHFIGIVREVPCPPWLISGRPLGGSREHYTVGWQPETNSKITRKPRKETGLCARWLVPREVSTAVVDLRAALGEDRRRVGSRRRPGGRVRGDKPMRFHEWPLGISGRRLLRGEISEIHRPEPVRGLRIHAVWLAFALGRRCNVRMR